MKLIMENWRKYLDEEKELDEVLGFGRKAKWEKEAEKQSAEAGEAPPAPTGIKTFEDLKKLLKMIELKRKGGIAGKRALSLAATMLPGAKAAKELYDTAKDLKDFLTDLYTADDNFKTQTGLDKLNVDDNISKIVDDQVEAAFLKALPKLIADKSGPIGDYNITKELQTFLASKFNKRTVDVKNA